MVVNDVAKLSYSSTTKSRREKTSRVRGVVIVRVRPGCEEGERPG
jgi:hypothetical protein